jgi:DNA-binding transcriptional ArsR family regulator
MDDPSESMQNVLRALANEKRMQMLEWLLDPTANFPPQRDGDLVDDGVCVGAITDKIGLSQPTVTNHLRILVDVKLVTSRPIKNWVFYKADRTVVLEALSRLRARFEI